MDEAMRFMPITIGTQLGSHEITALLGKGGMGEVYRARDTKLKREVAIKILPDEFLRDPARASRFQREAEVLASLNHPHIAAIYDLEEANDTRFLVLELVEGVTLAERIQRGPIPIEEAFEIARHICEALEAAHEKGIIHRDLKPANVKITPDGKVKVLDFGLAKVLEPEEGSSNFSESPTLLSGTLGGVILGTAPYMSPEQARGQAAGEQSDIWAFGAVLYEMLTGKPAFNGETLTDVLGGIVRTEPDWTALPETTPSLIRLLLRQCLQKNRAARLHHIADARIQIDAALNMASINAPIAQRATAPRRSTLWMVLAILLPLAVAATAVTFIVSYYRLASQDVISVRFSVPPPDKAEFGQVGTQPNIALSPDGRKLAFFAVAGGVNRLWIRPLDSVEARPLVGTEGVITASSTAVPFWSPDSRFVAYFAQGRLKKIDVAGGPPQTICDADGFSGTWSQNNIIVFDAGGNGGPLKRIPAGGGKPEPVTALDATRHEENHLYPYFLPDNDHFLFLVRGADPENNAIMAGSLTSKEVKLVINGNSRAAYDPSGYLLYVREGSLIAVPFDTGKLQVQGDPLPIAEAVRYNPAAGGAAITLSRNGVLAYRTFNTVTGNYKLTWLDRTGNALSTLGEAGFNINPKLSPDGKRVAVQRFDPQTGNTDIWVIDALRGIPTRLTFDAGADRDAVWSPNGEQIAFSSDQKQGGLYVKSSAGVGNQELILKTPVRGVWDWSADGKFIAYIPGRGGEISVLPLFGKREPLTYLPGSNIIQGLAQFSPDGHWVAYVSTESGKFEIYVQSFPTPSGKRQISTNGGLVPRWRRDGKEVFYIGNDRKLRAVPVRSGDKGFDISMPEVLFEVPAGVPAGNLGTTAEVSGYDVAADGRRFLFNVLAGPAADMPTPITVITNWTASLKR
jgi:Tol biopolymer transport system component/tRNA A-37 threonylcarbamoyl transferase component Bud32